MSIDSIMEWDQELNRKIQISFVGNDTDETVFNFYWNTLSKPTDKILLTHVIKSSVKEEDLLETEKKVLSADGVSSFMEQCKQRKIQFSNLFWKGKSGEGICELANECKPHLIVIGSRGLSKLQRTLQTSVSEYVLHKSHAPVLIVPYKS